MLPCFSFRLYAQYISAVRRVHAGHLRPCDHGGTATSGRYNRNCAVHLMCQCFHREALCGSFGTGYWGRHIELPFFSRAPSKDLEAQTSKQMSAPLLNIELLLQETPQEGDAQRQGRFMTNPPQNRLAWADPKACPRLIGHSMFTCPCSDTGRSRPAHGCRKHWG